MQKGELKTKKGFTIIETLLTLSIAGLIFLIVFLALPALQRSQRDTWRREDIDFLISKLKSYQTNHRGALPSKVNDKWTSIKPNSDMNKDTAPEWDAFYTDYIGVTASGETDFVDPSGEQYWLVVGYCGSGAAGQNCDTPGALSYSAPGPVGVSFPTASTAVFPNNFAIFIVIGAKCNGENAVRVKNTRKVAVLYKLESGGVYCANT